MSDPSGGGGGKHHGSGNELCLSRRHPETLQDTEKCDAPIAVIDILQLIYIMHTNRNSRAVKGICLYEFGKQLMRGSGGLDPLNQWLAIAQRKRHRSRPILRINFPTPAKQTM